MSARRKITVRALSAFALLSGVTPLAIHAQSPPDWKGYWIGEGLTAEISGFPGPEANYKLLGQDAPWNDVGRARVAATRERQADQKADGWGFP